MVYDLGHIMGFDTLRGFRTLGRSDREALAAATREQRVEAGAVVFREGQPADSLWAVKEGLVHLIKRGPEGREFVLEVFPPGELLGAVVALDTRPYPATAVALEASVLWRLPAALARGLCMQHPSLRAAILDQVAHRLRSAHDRLRSIALERTEQRLARMLVTLATKIGQPGDGATLISVTRQELADMIGATVETTIRITSKWQRDGIITSARHQLGLTDLEQLKRIASGNPPSGSGGSPQD